jgi:hypothetical protein
MSRTFSLYCARVTSGHPAAALPKSVMKSRRLMDRPFAEELTICGCLVQHGKIPALMSEMCHQPPRRFVAVVAAVPLITDAPVARSRAF